MPLFMSSTAALWPKVNEHVLESKVEVDVHCCGAGFAKESCVDCFSLFLAFLRFELIKTLRNRSEMFECIGIGDGFCIHFAGGNDLKTLHNR